jgi:2-polyprenyl-3-methyl-5-hydroxy-6-metoxy-1,4-benzoquinol methylase
MVYADSVAEELASGSFYQRRPFYLSPEKLESDYAPVRFERELRLFRRWCPAGAVLDVGCSTGAFLHQIKTRFPETYEVLGTDVVGDALDYAESRGLPVLRQDFLAFDFRAKRFDAVTFWAVMEHLVCPREFLNKAAEILKPGGHCFILVPNLNSLAVRLLGPKYRYIMAEHLNYFSSETLKAFASRHAELEIVASGSGHFNPVVIWQDGWSRQSSVPDEARARLLKRTTAWKQHGLLKPLKALYGGFERILSAAGLADNLWIVLRKRQSPRT